MMETISVLLIFFVLILVGMVFWVKISKSNIEIEQQELRQLRGIEIAQRVLFLPELQCSFDNVVTSDCIDILKLQSTEQVVLQSENKLYFFDRLGYSNITIKQIYPDSGLVKNLYSNALENYQNKIVTHLPISIYDPRDKRHSFGVLEVEVYS